MVATKTALTLPTNAEAHLAKDAARLLASFPSTPLRLRTLDGPQENTLILPATAVRLLARILNEMAHGNAVTLTPVQSELTTQEAAGLLNISRPTVIQLLDRNEIAFRLVGTHRRIRLDSLMQFKRRADADRLAALEELVAYDQELGL